MVRSDAMLNGRSEDRRFARIGPRRGEIRTRHTIAGPSQMPLPWPDLVILDPCRGGGVYLIRYTAAGEFGGDTWHERADDALRQAEFEFGEALGPWVRVPADESDPLAYALRQFAGC